MNKAIKNYETAAACVFRECEKEMKNYINSRQDAFSAVNKDIQKLRDDREKLGDKRFNKLLHDKMKEYADISKKFVKNEKNLKLQMCSATRCQKENMKNFVELQKMYEKDCKKDKDACKLVDMAKKIIKKGSASSDDMIKFGVKEQSVLRKVYAK